MPAYSLSVEEPLSGLKIGLPSEYFAAGCDPEVDAVVRAAADFTNRWGPCSST